MHLPSVGDLIRVQAPPYIYNTADVISVRIHGLFRSHETIVAVTTGPRMEVPHTPALEATSHHSFTISGVCDEFLRVIGVLPNRPLPALASGANTPGSLTLSDRSDLVNGKLFSNIILSVRSWHPLRLSTSNLDVLRSCVRGDGVKASSSKLWSVLAPILDTVFDLYIGDDLLFQLETVSQGLPAYDELECSMLSLLEDLCINGSQIVKFPAHSATPVAEDPPTPSVVDTEDDSGCVSFCCRVSLSHGHVCAFSTADGLRISLFA